MMWGHGPRDMPWMGVTMLVLVVVLIVSVVLLLRLSTSTSRRADTDLAESAHATLARRLAIGEITVEQYEVTRDALRRGTAS